MHPDQPSEAKKAEADNANTATGTVPTAEPQTEQHGAPAQPVSTKTQPPTTKDPVDQKNATAAAETSAPVAENPAPIAATSTPAANEPQPATDQPVDTAAPAQAPENLSNEQATDGTALPATEPAPPGQPPAGTPPPPKSKKVLFIAGGIGLFLILLISVVLMASLQNSSKQQGNPQLSPTPKADIKGNTTPTVAPQKDSHTLVYGAWTGQSTVVRAVGTTTSTVTTVATLPLAVKKLSILPDRNVLYIDQTDTLDLGNRVSVYNIKSKTIKLNIPASSGYKIEDYVLSPNKQFITIWEVSYAKGAKNLIGGKSRVYAVDLNNYTVKNLLYDENAYNKTESRSLAIHYPRAILNNGTVFSDKLIPNDPEEGKNWAYGMSVVDLDGTNKRDVVSVNEGTYGTQPYLASDSKYLVFSGYNGTKGDGKKAVNGVRQALLTPNTVDLLNTQTLQRFKLPNLPPSETYPSVKWDYQTGNVLITLVSATGKNETYAYNLGSQQAKKITLPADVARDTGVIAQLTVDKTLIGTQSVKEAHLGNLGQTTTYAYTQIATLNNEDGTVEYLSLQDPLAHYIELLPGSYFAEIFKK